jgi:3-oxoacyl-[acyl-carrier-protein] synthase III
MYQVNRSICIAGTGSYAPTNVVTNTELTKRVATTEQWILENLGIRERRVVSEGQQTSDLATKAALNALESAGLQPNDIDLIVVATATPDRKAPSTACLVQHKLNVTNGCPAFDLHAVCSGFLYAMSVGSQFIQSGIYKNVLVIGADAFSTITDWGRRDCVFFGDGAGAVVLQRTQDDAGFFSFELYADGRGQDHFTVFPQDKYFTMNGKAVYETATTVLPQAISSLLSRHSLSPKDISILIPHQPSVRVLRKTAEILDIPIDRVCMNMDRYANTAGATVALLLDETVRRGAIRAGDLVAFAAVGSGWTWGAALYRWR